jgi:hypothetical protein
VAGLLSLAAVASLPLVPFVGMLLAMLAPLPLVHLVALGRPSITGWGWVAVALAGALVVTRAPWLAAFFAVYLLLAAWPAVTVEAWLRRRWSSGRWLAIVTFGGLGVVTVIVAAAFYPGSAADGLASLLAGLTENSKELLAGLSGPGLGAEELLAQMVRAVAY